MKKLRKFCLHCGQGLIKELEDNIVRDFCPSCKAFFYENPLPVVSSIVDTERNILLVKRNRRPFKGYWCLPTGFAETGESIEDAALRELEEEAGIKGKIVRLLDVDSYNSRFYGDLLFLTFIVERTGGRLSAGDDSAKAQFWPVEKIPLLAFRSNRKALAAYMKSKRDYWNILDSIEHTGNNAPGGVIVKNALIQRLISIIEKNRDDIIHSWVEDVTHNQSTIDYHKYDRKKLLNTGERVTSQVILWMSGLYDMNHIKSFYRKLGRERKKAGFKVSETLSALSLIRRHIWDFAIGQGVWHKNIDIYLTFEMQRLMTIFFDLATFYLTQGFEER